MDVVKYKIWSADFIRQHWSLAKHSIIWCSLVFIKMLFCIALSSSTYDLRTHFQKDILQNQIKKRLRISMFCCRSSTGENWQQIMMACINSTKAKCENDPSKLCGTDFAYMYFMSFYMICSFLVICFASLSLLWFLYSIHISFPDILICFLFQFLHTTLTCLHWFIRPRAANLEAQNAEIQGFLSFDCQ